MKRDRIMMIDWNGPFQGDSTPKDPRMGHAFHKQRTGPKLRAWEFVVILAACTFTLLCIVWAKG